MTRVPEDETAAGEAPLVEDEIADLPVHLLDALARNIGVVGPLEVAACGVARPEREVGMSTSTIPSISRRLSRLS
jgi:hypothetical protein